jgi:hypothetical protein
LAVEFMGVRGVQAQEELEQEEQEQKQGRSNVGRR